MWGQRIITDPLAEQSSIIDSRYGVIEIRAGQLRQICLRPWPKRVSLIDVLWQAPWSRSKSGGDACWLYYNQPRGSSKYLALKYLVSKQGTTLATIQVALGVFDDIARWKQSDALVCDAANLRLSERIMQRYGWVRHTQSRWHRNYIKRFYGTYENIGALPVLVRSKL